MPADTHGPFPFGAARDLLGIARAMFRASSDETRRERLKTIGHQLRLALQLARDSGPGTMGRRAAWSHAEQATAALGDLVADGATVEPLVRAAAGRFSGSRSAR
jgi:hypothetical protein